MLHSDFKSVIRNIFRNKLTSIISILGLGMGLGCIIILLGLIIHEKSFDTNIPNHRNVYRIIFGNSAQTHYPLAENLAMEFPEVEDFFRYYQAGSLQLKTNGNEIVRIQGFGFADQSIFRILGIKFINGTSARTPGEVAISDEMALRYFGNLSPIGAVLKIKFNTNFTDLVVSGVYRKFPANSTLNASFIADIKLSETILRQFQRTLGDYGNENNNSLDWRYADFLSYVEIDKGTNLDEFGSKMDKYKEFIDNDNINNLEFRLQPVSEVYLKSGDIEGGYFLRQGNQEELKYYEIITLLILVISLTNFILLSRAEVSERMHEIGTRKVFGASQGKIKRLILLESFTITIISLIPAFFIIGYGMDFINTTLDKTLTNKVFLSPAMISLVSGVVILTGTLSGWLIGLRYSRIPALNLISERVNQNNKSLNWRDSFLVLHFAIYIILVSSLIGVSKQIKYSLTGYKGFNPENILITDLNTDELKKSFLTLSDEMKKIPGVLSVAGGTFIPPFGAFLPVNLATPDGNKVRLDGLIMGEGMPELLGMEIIDGSAFGPYKPGPPEVLLNESAAKEHNVKAGENLLAFNVRGILKDFHAHSMHSLISSMVILPQNPERMGLLAIKTDGKNDEAIINNLRDLYLEISPDEVFETRYLSDNLDLFYQNEKDQLKIIGAFALIATVLSVMGLFGISLMSISKRFREIGIRKVNGAKAVEILRLLDSEYIKWVFVSAVVSIPLAIWLISKWMERFAYRTKISWWIFGAALLSAIIIAMLTVSWQSWRASTRNPVEALRHE